MYMYMYIHVYSTLLYNVMAKFYTAVYVLHCVVPHMYPYALPRQNGTKFNKSETGWQCPHGTERHIMFFFSFAVVIYQIC